MEKYNRTRQATDDNIKRRIRFSCWIIMATDTRSEHVILIAFPLQQRLHERASSVTLYVHCLVVPINASSDMHLHIVYTISRL